MRAFRVATLLMALLLPPAHLAAQGHGPVYGLSTPTLGRGGWSLDLPAMARWGGGAGTSSMLRPMVAYGVTEDVQLSLSWPLPLTLRPGGAARGRPTGAADRDQHGSSASRLRSFSKRLGAEWNP